MGGKDPSFFIALIISNNISPTVPAKAVASKIRLSLSLS